MVLHIVKSTADSDKLCYRLLNPMTVIMPNSVVLGETFKIGVLQKFDFHDKKLGSPHKISYEMCSVNLPKFIVVV